MKKKAVKKVQKRAAVKKAVKKVAKKDVDTFGFTKGSKSSQAILMLAEKALLKDVRRKFSTLSFNKLFLDLKRRGFKVENKEGLFSITAQPAKG
jgi:hypothetical protein